MAKPSADVVHHDKIDQEIVIGTSVVFRHGNEIVIGIVERMTPKMVEVCRVPKHKWGSSLYRKYPKDLVTIDNQAVTMYMLKNAS
jgi:hypothetical protein